MEGISIDVDLANADWVHGMSWDLPTDPDYYVIAYGDKLGAWLEDIESLPAGKAMPESLRSALHDLCAPETKVVRHIRTPEGRRKYGGNIGDIIELDPDIPGARRHAVSKPINGASFRHPKPKITMPGTTPKLKRGSRTVNGEKLERYDDPELNGPAFITHDGFVIQGGVRMTDGSTSYEIYRPARPDDPDYFTIQDRNVGSSGGLENAVEDMRHFRKIEAERGASKPEPDVANEYPGLKITPSDDYDDWDVVKAGRKTYFVGPDGVTDPWVATEGDSWDAVVFVGDSRDDVLSQIAATLATKPATPRKRTTATRTPRKATTTRTPRAPKAPPRPALTITKRGKVETVVHAGNPKKDIPDATYTVTDGPKGFVVANESGRTISTHKTRTGALISIQTSRIPKTARVKKGESEAWDGENPNIEGEGEPYNKQGVPFSQLGYHYATYEERVKYKLPPQWKNAWIADNPDNPPNNLIAKGWDGQTWQPRYNDTQADKRYSKRLEVVSQGLKALPEILESYSDWKDNEAAATVLLMYALGLRPSAENSDQAIDKMTGKPIKTYGATTLEARHVSFEGKTARLRFLGKKTVPQDIVVTDPEVVQMLKHYMGKAKRDTQDPYDTNVTSAPLFPNATTQDARNLLAERVTSMHLTPKNLRTLRSNIIVANGIASKPVPTTEKEYLQAIKDVVALEATALGHTPTIAKASYIIMDAFRVWQQDGWSDPK